MCPWLGYLEVMWWNMSRLVLFGHLVKTEMTCWVYARIPYMESELCASRDWAIGRIAADHYGSVSLCSDKTLTGPSLGCSDGSSRAEGVTGRHGNPGTPPLSPQGQRRVDVTGPSIWPLVSMASPGQYTAFRADRKGRVSLGPVRSCSFSPPLFAALRNTCTKRAGSQASGEPQRLNGCF